MALTRRDFLFGSGIVFGVIFGTVSFAWTGISPPMLFVSGLDIVIPGASLEMLSIFQLIPLVVFSV